MSYYTIIIPIFNEKLKIQYLLDGLQKYNNIGHEILIINDGSTDGSKEILSKCNFINLINLDNNMGKGTAVIKGLESAKNNKVLIFDGDLELNPEEIEKLMILNRKININSVFANRFNNHYSFSIWNIGNKLLTVLFNFLNTSNLKDALCCAKSFYKSDVQIDKLKSKKFDIDVEISSNLMKINSFVQNININYNRRNIEQGKKLRLKDSFSIFLRIIQNRKCFKISKP